MNYMCLCFKSKNKIIIIRNVSKLYFIYEVLKVTHYVILMHHHAYLVSCQKFKFFINLFFYRFCNILEVTLGKHYLYHFTDSDSTYQSIFIYKKNKKKEKKRTGKENKGKRNEGDFYNIVFQKLQTHESGPFLLSSF